MLKAMDPLNTAAPYLCGESSLVLPISTPTTMPFGSSFCAQNTFDNTLEM